MKARSSRQGTTHLMSALFLTTMLWLAGCAAFGQGSPEPLPTVMLNGGSSGPNATAAPIRQNPSLGEGVTASGMVASAHQVQLAFAVAGKVQAVNVAVGEQVEAGQILASLDSTEAQLAMQQAEVALTAARASYDMAHASAQARRAAQVTAATLALTEAQSALEKLQQNAPLVAAEAQAAVTNAQDALEEAQRDRTNMNYPRANQTTIDNAQAFYDLKEIELQEAKDAYDGVRDRAADDPRRAMALLNLTNAQSERDKALISLNWYLGKNSEQDIAQADAQLALAQAQLDAAQRRWEEAKDGPSTADLALAEARIANAQAQLDLADAQSTEAELAQVQAQVDAAAINLELAQAQLAKTQIAAPFVGVVAAQNLQVGAWMLPGQAGLVLVDMDQLQVETTDLSERDLPQVAIGQAVTIYIKALNQETAGRVIEISPLADTLGGDIVYKTTISLEEILPDLRVGMSVEVQFKDKP